MEGGPLESYLIHLWFHPMLGGDHHSRSRQRSIDDHWPSMVRTSQKPPKWGGPEKGQKRPKNLKMTQKKHRLLVGALHLHQEMY
jgi:hypothetical protein